ncbi:hypothetical protein PV326_008080 [Microctonus aethiopoides]|uniref:SET domain-containing protein n=1 Tax=Microctonus aethiopoides TaxID=144406 RepID=A0AA39KT85_9HYME|nr:hypothetical protein PV326_008080 [Microctonus aethiopoides]KAK0172751.1 hypothetical protein PV328_006030 [Microctonus aethiopoides]
MLIKEIMSVDNNNTNNKPIVKYKVSCSEKYGRYLMASRKINAGEVIFRENPVIVGAAEFNKNYLCFTCLRVISTNVITINSSILCSNCGVAIFCCVACEARKSYHTIEECEILKRKIISLKSVKEILLPLRLWLIKKKDQVLWEKIISLEAHLEARRGTNVWKDREENIINVLKSLKIIDKAEENNFFELLQRLCGILDVNSFELRSPGSLDNSLLRGLYLEAALMAHDCRGNTHLTVDDDFLLTIYASRPIDEGEVISFNYTSSLLGTAERREHLREGKYFECECSMCQDPEELGANLSTIFCPRCKEGLVMLQNVKIKSPYGKEKNWQCKKCRNLLSGRLIKTCLDLTKMQINQADVSIKELENLVKKLSSTFHPHHFLMVNLKQKLLTLYRSDCGRLNPSKKMLCRVIELCNEILDVLEIVEPGISRLKGLMLYEIHMPIVILANRNYVAREITSEELSKQLELAENCLKRSLTMLLLEPATTPEGILAKRALQEYKALRQHKNDINALPPLVISNKN